RPRERLGRLSIGGYRSPGTPVCRTRQGGKVRRCGLQARSVPLKKRQIALRVEPPRLRCDSRHLSKFLHEQGNGEITTPGVPPQLRFVKRYDRLGLPVPCAPIAHQFCRFFIAASLVKRTPT